MESLMDKVTEYLNAEGFSDSTILNFIIQGIVNTALANGEKDVIEKAININTRLGNIRSLYKAKKEYLERTEQW